MTPSEFNRQQEEIDRLKARLAELENQSAGLPELERMAADIEDIKRTVYRAAPVRVLWK